MPLADKERTSEDWDKELATAGKRHYFKDEAKKLYREKKLKDGEIFFVKGCYSKREGAKETEDVVIAMMLFHKFIYVRYGANDRRLAKLKRNGIAALARTSKTGMVNVRQVPWVPHQFQSAKDPGFMLYGADSIDENFEGSKFKKARQMFDERELLAK